MQAINFNFFFFCGCGHKPGTMNTQISKNKRIKLEYLNLNFKLIIIHKGLFAVWVHRFICTKTVPELDTKPCTNNMGKNGRFWPKIYVEELVVHDISDLNKGWTRHLVRFKRLRTPDRAASNPISVIKTKVREQIFKNYLVQERTAVMSHVISLEPLNNNFP